MNTKREQQTETQEVLNVRHERVKQERARSRDRENRERERREQLEELKFA